MALRLLALSLATAALLASAAARADPVDDLIDAEMKARLIPGLALAVVRQGKLVKARGYGMADLEARTAATEDTPFQLASVTKQFVAAGIMLLVQDGKLSTGDPISKHLPATPLAWKDITIRHLLTHTSGIADYLGASLTRSWRAEKDPRLHDLVRGMPSAFAPGEKHQYSNTGYVLLGQIVEAVSGKPYDRFLAERIFTPLGMRSTRRRVVGDRHLAVGYLLPGTKDQRLRRAPLLPPALWDNGDGGLVSTARDMALWDQALAAGKLLAPSFLSEMYTRAKTNDGADHDYGYGMVVNVVGKHRVIGHGGRRPGVTANFTRWVDDGVSVVVLCNVVVADPNGLYPVARGVARLFAPEVP
jgi:CubicO group peptidase (beta-lactamase class C family)